MAAELSDDVLDRFLRYVQVDTQSDDDSETYPSTAKQLDLGKMLADELREIGHWGPRPAVLQSWVMANRLTTPKSELYPQVRKWYARDHGETTIREVLETAGFPVARVA